MKKRFLAILLGSVLLLALLPVPALAQSDILLPDGMEENPLPNEEARTIVILVFAGLAVVAAIMILVAAAKMRKFRCSEEAETWMKRETEEETTEKIHIKGG